MGKLAVIMLLVVLLTGIVSVSPGVGAVISSEEVKATAKLEPSGSIIRNGNIRLRFDLFLEPDAPGYNIHHIQVPVIPPEGYLGKVDEQGAPINQSDYDRWLEGLPRVWQNNPFLCVFVSFPPSVTDSEIKTKEQEILRLAYDHWVRNNSVSTVHKTLFPILPKLPPMEETPEATNRLEEIINQKDKFAYDPKLNLTFNFKTLFFAWANPDAIDIGSAATNRASRVNVSTRIPKDNPANATGTITSVEIWCDENLVNCEVATFVVVAGNNLSTRDSEALGAVTSGSKQTFAGLDMDVVTGDYLGTYYSGGFLDRDLAGLGMWYAADNSDQIPCTNYAFGSIANQIFSLYGTGETVGVVAPTVVTNAATSVEETTATLSGNITATGGENCTDRGFQWDIDTGAPYADNWTEAGSFGVGNFTHGVTGLTKGELYYYRAGANNTAGWGWGAEVTFLTKPDEPNTLVATGLSGQIDLTWNKGTGADNTTITAKQNSYPANRADGTVIYDSTGTSYSHTGLGDSENWYYRAWSWCTEGGLEQYSDTYAQANATTSGVPPAFPSEILPEGIPAPIGIGHLAWFIPLVLFSVPAFWRRNALLFMLAAACSLMMGFYWYVIFTTNLGLSLGIVLVGFGLVCLVFAIGCLFKRRRTSEE